jgi:hypothetical protein
VVRRRLRRLRRDGSGHDADASPSAALRRFRAHHRSRKRRDTDPFDAFYRLYVGGLIGLFVFYLALGLVDDVTVDPAGVDWATRTGPLWVSLVAAVAITLGVRSGANGGPLAIDDLELHHVLLSPLDRSEVLRDPARQLLTFALGMGALFGAAAGELASRRLPGSQTEWVLSGLLVGAAITLSGVGAAFLAATSRPGRRRRAIIIGLSMVPTAWAVVDLVRGRPTSPTSGFGDLAVWALDARPTASIGLVVPVVLAVWGWNRKSALSIERAHHRSQLVAQIRFALAQQDIRSLLLLRRQLAFETPRANPWMRIHAGGRVENRFPVMIRDARSYARWPLGRILRVTGLAAIAGLSLAAVWQGTTAMIVVVGVALYLAAIEVIEPLSQELDHPGIMELIPIAPGKVILGHITIAIAAMSAVWAVVGLVAMATALDWRVGAASAIAAIPAATAAVAAGGLSIKRFDSPALTIPAEVEGPRMLFRLLWPPALTLAGALPVLLARNALASGSPLLPAATTTAGVVALIAALAVAWIRYRDEFAIAAAEAQGRKA